MRRRETNKANWNDDLTWPNFLDTERRTRLRYLGSGNCGGMVN